jgi:hypothetical protein
MKTYTIPQYGITVTVGDNGAGVISSKLKSQLFDYEEGHCSGMVSSEKFVAEAQANALESFILALACQGYDISEPRFVTALQSSLEAIVNHS